MLTPHGWFQLEIGRCKRLAFIAIRMPALA